MKSTWLLVCVLALSPLAVEASERASRESVEKLMEVTEVSSMVDAMQSQVDGMFEGFAAQLNLSDADRPAFEKYKAKLIALLNEEVTWEKLKEPTLEIYMRHFSEEEVQGLIEFYSSDIGQSMIRKMPLVMQESMTISQGMLQTLMPRIQALAAEMQDEIALARAEGSGN